MFYYRVNRVWLIRDPEHSDLLLCQHQSKKDHYVTEDPPVKTSYFTVETQVGDAQ